MREILFRGFHKDENGKEKVYINGEWIKGYWVEGSLINNVFFKSDKKKAICYILNVDDVDYDCFEDLTDNLGYYEVLPETVGQYTGLKDKNGKKIFEGDIVHAVYQVDYVGCKDVDYGIGVVKYCASYYGGASYEIDIIGDSGSRVFTASLENGVEVIGNIHSNPELLEV